jgi:hypothetical protein
MLLTVCASMAWVLAQLHAKQGDLGIVCGIGLTRPSSNACIADNFTHG